MVKISECPQASSKGDRPTGFNRSKAAPQCEQYAARLQVSNVLARNCGTAGVQDTPKSLIGSFTWNVETSYLRLIFRQVKPQGTLLGVRA